jgi:hypothetical protein
MTTSVFDTLSYAKRLKSAGVPEAQAEAQAEALAEAVGGQLVTRRDLAEAVRALNEAITLAKRDMSEAILKLEARMTASDGRVSLLQWMAGFNIALTVTVLFKIFP